jgi:integrase
MKIHELQIDSYIEEWFLNINPSANTKRMYIQAMQAYTEYTGRLPEELVIEAESEIKAGILPRQRRIKRYLTGFRKQLQDSELANKTIHGYLSAVKSFYSAFDVDIPRLQKTEVVTVLEENMQIPTKEDLQDILKVCTVLEKVLLLVGVSSGLSSNEIIRLKVKDFKQGYDPESKITTLQLRRQKVKVDFITFLSPEASQAVQDYLNYRNRQTKLGEQRRQSQLEKQKVFSDNNYLFCKQNIPNTFLESKNDEERQLTHQIIITLYRAISEKARKSSGNGNWNLIRSHNCRRYFNSVLLNNGCDSFHVEFFMGHKLDATRTAYFRASPEKLRGIYAKYIPYLTIAPEKDVSESIEYQQIKKENEILQRETARHVVERKELQDLREQLIANQKETDRKMKNISVFLEKLATGDEDVAASFDFYKNAKKEKQQKV